MVPARKAAAADLNDSLRLGGRARAGGSQLFGDALVVAEVVIALVLIAGAGLVVQSFNNLKSYYPGFEAERVLTVRTSLRGESFAEPHQRIAHFEELSARLSQLPGVTGASATSFVPPLNAFRATTFRQRPGVDGTRRCIVRTFTNTQRRSVGSRFASTCTSNSTVASAGLLAVYTTAIPFSFHRPP